MIVRFVDNGEGEGKVCTEMGEFHALYILLEPDQAGYLPPITLSTRKPYTVYHAYISTRSNNIALNPVCGKEPKRLPDADILGKSKLRNEVPSIPSRITSIYFS